MKANRGKKSSRDSHKKEKKEMDWDSYKKAKNKIISSNKKWFKNLWKDDHATLHDYYDLYVDTIRKLRKKGLTDADEDFDTFDRLWQDYTFRAEDFDDAWEEWTNAIWNV